MVAPQIRARNIYVAHEVLFRQEGRAVFEVPGEYDVRVRARIGSANIVSDIVTVRVRPVPAKQRAMIERDAQLLSRAVQADVDAIGGEPVAIDRIRANLSDCALKRNLTWVGAVLSLTKSGLPQLVERELAKANDTGYTVGRDILTFAYVDELRRRKQYTKARTLLRTIRARGYWRDRLDASLREDQRHRADPSVS